MNGLSSLRVGVPFCVRNVAPKTPLKSFLSWMRWINSRKVVSPSLRTTMSSAGHSWRAFVSQKLAWLPPSIVVQFGWVSLAMVRICLAEL